MRGWEGKDEEGVLGGLGVGLGFRFGVFMGALKNGNCST
jgi:hypothetical protein